MRFAKSLLGRTMRNGVFERMAKRAGIDHRYSFLEPARIADGPSVDAEGFYMRGEFPSTAKRMRYFKTHAPDLAADAIAKLELGAERDRVTHVHHHLLHRLSAPGLDLEIIARCGLPDGIERTIVGFMGCYAAINALKLARHIVRSEPEARVLRSISNSAHCISRRRRISRRCYPSCCGATAAPRALVTSEAGRLRAARYFRAVIVPEEAGKLITWNIGDPGLRHDFVGRGAGDDPRRAWDQRETKSSRAQKAYRDRPVGGASGRAHRA